MGLLALAALPAAARAEDLYFRNDTDAPIIIQGSCLVNGKLVNGRPNLVQAGAKAQIRLPGNKVITIREARAPNRLLHQTTVPAGMEDLFILIKPDPKGTVKVDRTTKKEFVGGK